MWDTESTGQHWQSPWCWHLGIHRHSGNWQIQQCGRRLGGCSGKSQVPGHLRMNSGFPAMPGKYHMWLRSPFQCWHQEKKKVSTSPRKHAAFWVHWQGSAEDPTLWIQGESFSGYFVIFICYFPYTVWWRC